MQQRLKLSILSLALIGAGVISAAHAADATDVGTVNIAGQGDDLGNGLLIDEDGSKAKSTVTKAAIEKARASANPFQLLNLEPGVNASSFDATGLFGGNLRVRGFNSDQMGMTINGAPVNDSGNFAVYPQEYTDSENLCEISVTQGSAETDAPHIDASGGNISMVSCGPNDRRGGKIEQSLGQLRFRKTFVRLDSGLVGTTSPAKGFVSFSQSNVDKFKGFGGADRQHVDAGLDWKLTADTRFNASLLYNRAINNNYYTVSLAQWQGANPNIEYSNVVPQHLASGNEGTTANFGTSATHPAYYGYSINPFENALFTSRLESRINERLTLSAEPYFWWGYGTGGTEQSTLAESNSPAKLGGGIADINHNGNTTDTVGVYSGSLTQTSRPGITFKAAWELDNQKILAGYWIERARQLQTKPATTVSNSGWITDPWLSSGLLTLNNGQTYEGRDYLTISTDQSLFVIDTINLAGGRLQLTPAARYSQVKRDFTNYASYGSGLGADYKVDRTYGKFLPSLGATYKASNAWQIYGNITQNMRAPSNFVLSGWVTGVSYANGVPTQVTLTPNNAIQMETSTNYEGGVRFTGQAMNASLAVYHVDFKNRIAQGYNPSTNTYTDYNVGNSTIDGVEAAIGTKPIQGWSVFGSATYTKSTINADFPSMRNGVPVTLATTGKTFPDTPEWMLASSLQYARGPFMAALSAKYTGMRYSTLMNDESIPGFTTFDLDVGYRLPSMQYLKNPTLRFNVSNLFNKQYLLANAGSGSNITATTDGSYKGGGSPTYYIGAPRFFSMSLTAEF